MALLPECWAQRTYHLWRALGTSRVSVTNNSPITFCISSSSGKLSLVGTYNTGSGTGKGGTRPLRRWLMFPNWNLVVQTLM